MTGIVDTPAKARARIASGQMPRYEVEDTRNITPGYRYRIREVWPDGFHTTEDLFSLYGDSRLGMEEECQRLNGEATA